MTKEQNGKRQNTQFIVAVIGLIGVLGAALITSWDKFFPSKDPDNTTTTLPMSANRQPNEGFGKDPTLTMEEAQRMAEKIAAQWVDAWQAGDTTTLVNLSSPPFFLDNEILISVADVRSRYQVTVEQTKSGNFAIDRIMSGSIGEYKNIGYVTTNDRLLSRMQLSDDDIVVIFVVSTDSISEEGIGFYFRRLGDRLEMAGFWD